MLSLQEQRQSLLARYLRLMLAHFRDGQSALTLVQSTRKMVSRAALYASALRYGRFVMHLGLRCSVPGFPVLDIACSTRNAESVTAKRTLHLNHVQAGRQCAPCVGATHSDRVPALPLHHHWPWADIQRRWQRTGQCLQQRKHRLHGSRALADFVGGGRLRQSAHGDLVVAEHLTWVPTHRVDASNLVLALTLSHRDLKRPLARHAFFVPARATQLRWLHATMINWTVVLSLPEHDDTLLAATFPGPIGQLDHLLTRDTACLMSAPR
eukprot:3125716-Rhodomonas_salina.6